MLGLILIYFIAKNFSDLAGAYKKNKWVFALLGVAFYYITSFTSIFLLVVLAELAGWYGILELGETGLGFLAVPFGIIGCVLLYGFLKKRWADDQIKEDHNILDQNIF
ncbi:MAG: hypothetical protein AAF573_16405 [Bacteroidota bacterium]